MTGCRRGRLMSINRPDGVSDGLLSDSLIEVFEDGDMMSGINRSPTRRLFVVEDEAGDEKEGMGPFEGVIGGIKSHRDVAAPDEAVVGGNGFSLVYDGWIGAEEAVMGSSRSIRDPTVDGAVGAEKDEEDLETGRSRRLFNEEGGLLAPEKNEESVEDD
jgi:hypothetical protein